MAMTPAKKEALKALLKTIALTWALMIGSSLIMGIVLLMLGIVNTRAGSVLGALNGIYIYAVYTSPRMRQIGAKYFAAVEKERNEKDKN